MHLPWAILPALLLKVGTSAARSADAALRRGLEHSLRRHTVHHAAALPMGSTDLSKRHYTGEAMVAGTLGDVLEQFEDFAVEELHCWRKVSAFVEASGRAQAVFSGQFTVPVRLEARTVWSRMREGLEASGATVNPLNTNVPYRYVVHFYFDPADGGVHVAHDTTETVAPYGLLERDVTRHYEAPALPRGIGAVGDRFIDRLRSATSRRR